MQNPLFCLKIDIYLFTNIAFMFNDLPSKVIKWLIVTILGLYLLDYIINLVLRLLHLC